MKNIKLLIIILCIFFNVFHNTSICFGGDLEEEIKKNNKQSSIEYYPYQHLEESEESMETQNLNLEDLYRNYSYLFSGKKNKSYLKLFKPNHEKP